MLVQVAVAIEFAFVCGENGTFRRQERQRWSYKTVAVIIGQRWHKHTVVVTSRVATAAAADAAKKIQGTFTAVARVVPRLATFRKHR